MSLSIIESPIGKKVRSSYSVDIFNSGGNATFAQPVAMSNGDWIYIQGYVEDYNGFWKVSKSGTNVRLQDKEGNLVPYIVDQSVTVYTCFQNAWNCAHLPITYTLKSTLYPTNTQDPVANIIIVVDTNGYLTIGHSGLSGADALVDLDFVVLSDGTNTEIVQVLDVLLTTSVVVNSKYRGVSYTTIQKYRNNYHAIVKVYAGLDASHTWTSLKPYELAATLKFIPDSNNEIQFSVSEVIKAYINQRNGTIQATLPLDLDSFTQFKISYAEAYDESNNYTVGSYEGTFTNDSSYFAVNSMLEFKNRYSGFMSDYLVDSFLTGAKFLTLFTRPTIFSGKYFDISFITEFNTTLVLRKNWVDPNGNVIYTSDENITNYSKGLYRIPLTAEHGCDFQNITYSPSITYLNSQFTTDLDGWEPTSAYTDVWFWDSGSQSASRLQRTQDSIAILSYNPFELRPISPTIKTGDTIRVRTLFSIEPDYLDCTMTITLRASPSKFVTVGSFLKLGGNAQLIVDTNFVVPQYLGTNQEFVDIGFIIEGGMDPSSQVYVDYFRVDNVPVITNITTDPLYLQLQILNNSDDGLSEQKTFDIDCSCSNQSIYLTWRNNLGGMDYWNFTAWSEYGVDINGTGETKTNLLPSWPNSYGENASEIRKQTFRDSAKKIVVSSQNLTLDQKLAIEYIKSSTIVEIMYSRADKRRVIVDADSFTSYKDNDKLYTVSFTISFTDNIPSQRL